MNINKRKLRLFSTAVAVLLMLSLAYRIALPMVLKKQYGDTPGYEKDKKVVSVWLKKNYFTDQLKEQVTQFNINHEDIFIDLEIQDEDYYNLLRLSMMTVHKPDIFQFGFYEHIQRDQLYTLEELGIDQNSYDKNTFLYYMGKPMGIKIIGANLKLAWNKEIFKASGLDPEKPPKTWDEVLLYAQKIKEAFPDTAPFEFPASNFFDLRASVGENSVNLGNITTMYWDYKKGKYDFSYAKDILTIYNKMYNQGLIPKDFGVKDKLAVRTDFKNKKAAMIISNYEDKVSFLTDLPLGFEIGVAEMPVLYEGQKQMYYFVEEIITLVASNNLENPEEVKEVYSWLVNTCLDREVVDVMGYSKGKNPVYDLYDNKDNFTFEEKDPTLTLNFSQPVVKSMYHSAINGSKSVEVAIKELNEYFSKYVNEAKQRDKNYFETYYGKE